ncbi:energy-coupling factor ABC transporter ATP-binding protein [Pelosinus sp. sgz500959]|uniref:energy-coupling factor ABC transporter ATP-binding protein n=1 Tax=Pelosinus sp. sgz500959 TaxID=3242472 RepID=UPI00366EE3F1
MLKNLVFDLQNIGYAYGQNECALENISLKISAGEKLVLLGANGCGKSTLQKVLAGLIFPHKGKVQAFGWEINQDSMKDKVFAATFRQKVGFVFQNSDVQIFCASVLDEIMFGPLSMGMDYAVARSRALELLEFVGITHLMNRLPHHLSGGEKKKVAIAAVLAVNPDVLILDEPTNGLDPKTQAWMRDTLNQLNQQGKTIIIATHQLELVPELASRVVVMGENHQILADDQPVAILENRLLLLSANLIGEHQHVHIHGQNRHVHVHRHVEVEGNG